jgi:glyoxylase-like metal-dependent hydrolase (beta-lactamase superfamily II)
VIRTGGFTTGHQVVLVEGRGPEASTFAWFGDLLPRRWHGNPRWVTALDDLPLDSVTAKTELFGRAAAEGWRTIPAHEPAATVGRLVPDRDRFRFEVAADS